MRVLARDVYQPGSHRVNKLAAHRLRISPVGQSQLSHRAHCEQQMKEPSALRRFDLKVHRPAPIMSTDPPVSPGPCKRRTSSSCDRCDSPSCQPSTTAGHEVPFAWLEPSARRGTPRRYTCLHLQSDQSSTSILGDQIPAANPQTTHYTIS